MRDPVAFLLFVSLLAIVFLKGNQAYDQSWYEELKGDIKEDFDELDQNKDDFIDKDEFSMKVNLTDVESRFKEYDADGDGKINETEFTEEFLNFKTVTSLPSET